jgi:ATP-dependent Lon protease
VEAIMDDTKKSSDRDSQAPAGADAEAPEQEERSPDSRPAEPADPQVDAASPDEATGSVGEVMPAIPEILPILPLRNVVVFPLSFLPLSVGQPRSVRLIDEATLGERVIGLVLAKDPENSEPSPEEIHEIGTAAYMHRMVKGSDGNIGLFVQGLRRFKIEEWVATEPYLQARVVELEDEMPEGIEAEALTRKLTELFGRLVNLVPHMPEELLGAVEGMDDARAVAYFIAANTRLEVAEAQRLLEMETVELRMRSLISNLSRELEVLELGRRIQQEARGEMEKGQREYFLRQQLKAIQKELGEDDERVAELEQMEARIDESGMSDEARSEALRELGRLRSLPEASAEYGVIRTYLDWMIDLPWAKTSEDQLDIANARRVLDEDHYGLQDIKARILEFLAVQKLRRDRGITEHPGDVSGGILAFVGPPGVGKTSLGRSIARSLGREFVRMSLGGLRDEAEIRGHRRTYIGAMPGRIIQGLKRAGTRNPVFMLDEIDKVGASFRGDPESALLEVLDPQQNAEFRDLYLDVPFDLTDVLFIATGNVLGQISGPLRDRMEIIELSSYTETDKLHIARGYLLPRQLRENGLRSGELDLSDAAIRRIARRYTREAGVRNLERQIGTICRKVAVGIAERAEVDAQVEAEVPAQAGTQVETGLQIEVATPPAPARPAEADVPVRAEAEGSEPTQPLSEGGALFVDEDDLRDLLGPERFSSEVAERTDTAGVATGLAFTPFGGEILFVEASAAAGKKGFLITGQLGDVMKESAQAALSYVRAQQAALGIPDGFFAEHDLHLHVPAGATPKDGPSAGVTMATALASLLTGRPVRADLAMTGEITLRGKVLPVGGIKEKVLAAHRAGLKTVILPRRNAPDLEEVPEEVREDLHFELVDKVDEVWALALRELEAGDAPVQRQPIKER